MWCSSWNVTGWNGTGWNVTGWNWTVLLAAQTYEGTVDAP
jgi:hypothetical protein